ncbi:MAG: DUF4331 family protein [Streptosporangiaceae bacterium]
MSNHFSAANIKSPGGDPRLDLTDVFAFKAPHDPGQTVLIMDVDPFRSDSMFHPNAVYRLNIDTDGDAHADASLRFLFSPPDNGSQTGTAYYSTGSHAGEPEPSEEVLLGALPVSTDGAIRPLQSGTARLFAGVRSDPFFADIEGALHGFQWTGHDDFAGANVLSIAMQVPDDMLSQRPEIGVWATVSLWQDGKLTQMDRGGHPTINPFINPDDEKDEYNLRQPADDVKNYLGPWSELLQKMGGYSAADAKDAALQALPDILRYDRTKPASYPNGRVLTDDVYSNRFRWLSNGQIVPDGLHPHDDMSSDFPFLGPPNPSPAQPPQV